MAKVISAIEKVVYSIEWVSEWSGKASSWLILGMLAAMGYEITARYIFNSPTIWAHELTTMLYGSFTLLAGAYTYLNDGHVRMDAVYRLFPRRKKATADFFAGLLVLGFLGTFLFITAKHAAKSWAYAEYSTWSPWKPPLGPFKTALAVAVLLLLLQQIAWLIRNFTIMLNIKSSLTKAPPKEAY